MANAEMTALHPYQHFEDPEDDIFGRSWSMASYADVRPTKFEKLQWRVCRIVESFWVRCVLRTGLLLAGVLLIFSDLVLLVVTFSQLGWDLNRKTDRTAAPQIIAIIIISLLSVELLLRIFALGPRDFFIQYLNILDFVVVISSILLTSIPSIGESYFVA
jgi:hypothetical protein